MRVLRQEGSPLQQRFPGFHRATGLRFPVAPREVDNRVLHGVHQERLALLHRLLDLESNLVYFDAGLLVSQPLGRQLALSCTRPLEPLSTVFSYVSGPDGLAAPAIGRFDFDIVVSEDNVGEWNLDAQPPKANAPS